LGSPLGCATSKANGFEPALCNRFWDFFQWSFGTEWALQRFAKVRPGQAGYGPQAHGGCRSQTNGAPAGPEISLLSIV
jgi:hypothetical protein